MIDLIKKYIDTGLELPEYQVKKLLNNRSLFNTYIRKRAIAVKNRGKFSKNEMDRIKYAIENNYFNDKMIQSLIESSGSIIQFIVNPSEELQLVAVKQKGGAIEHIKNPSEQVQLAAVNKSGNEIEYIINKGIVPSEQVQLAAVNQNAHYVEYIIKKGIEPSEEVQLAAVKQNPYVIHHIQNPSEQVQLAAVKQYPYAIQGIKNPYPSVINYVNSLKK